MELIAKRGRRGKRVFGKRGVLFTLAAIIIAIAIVLAFRTQHGEMERRKSDVITARVLSINDFLRDVEGDLGKGILITSTRTLLGIQEYLTEEGEYLPNATEAFREGFLQGSIEGDAVGLLVNATFPDWTRKIQTEAAKIGILANFTVEDVIISQQTPWSLNITIRMGINISDERNTASWMKYKDVSSQVSILGLEDPLYSIETQGVITNTIARTNTTLFAIGYNVTPLMLQANRSLYLASALSPSYLMRLEGDMGQSPMGIESLVNVPKLLANNIAANGRSIADVQYFGAGADDGERINNTPEWVRIDSARLALYNLTNLTI